MEDCIFCRIVNGGLPSFRVYEDNEFLGFLDISQIVEGMTVLTTKKHYSSLVFEMPPDVYSKFLTAGQKTANLLKEKFEAKRVFMVIEGLDVDHAHIKLYPIKEEKPLGVILAEGHNSSIKSKEELAKVFEKINKK